MGCFLPRIFQSPFGSFYALADFRKHWNLNLCHIEKLKKKPISERSDRKVKRNVVILGINRGKCIVFSLKRKGLQLKCTMVPYGETASYNYIEA